MTAPAIRMSGLRKNFGVSEIIRGVDLDIHRGERHAIIGPNGAGKSTLFHLISARLPVTSGVIELKGENVIGLKPFEINRRGLSRSFQITNIFHNLSVFENLRCAVLWSLGYRYSFRHRLAGLHASVPAPERVLRDPRREPRPRRQRRGLPGLRHGRAGRAADRAAHRLGRPQRLPQEAPPALNGDRPYFRLLRTLF